MKAQSIILILATSVAMTALADEKPHSSPEAPEANAGDVLYAKSGDGFLGMRLEAGSIILAVMDADKKPVAVKEGSATLFLAYVEDGHKSKLDLELEPAGSVFKAPLPKEGHGKTKVVAKVTADGKSHQGSFEFDFPKADQ